MHREFIQKLTSIVEANLANENFGPVELAKEAGFNHSSLNRKLKMICNQTNSQFIREIRLKKAKELLQNEELTIAEISYRVGFGSPTYFSKCFHEYFGHAPGEMRDLEPEYITESQFPEVRTKKFSQRKMMISTVAGLIVVISLTVFIVRQNFLFIPGKSIAVMPFINDNRNSTDDFFINGVSETIMDKLSQIEDLNVKSRSSTEIYRNNRTKSTRRVGHELRVRYIVEGSGQKIGDSVLISVQLIEVRKDRHFFSRQYTGKYEDIFSLYNEIAFDVAANVKAIITPEEKKLINNSSSKDLEVMRMMIQGNEMLNNANINHSQRNEFLKQAEIFYRNAINIDSINSQAWIQMGNAYLNRQEYDSAMVFAKKAIRISPDNSDAHLLTGLIYCFQHNAGEMEKSLKIAIKYNPENYWAVHWLGGLYYYRGEFSKAIEHLFKTKEMLGELGDNSGNLELQRSELNTLRIFRTLFALGFYDEAKKYAETWLKLSNDDVWGYNYNIQWAEIINCNFEKGYQFGKNIFNKSPDLVNWDYMGMSLQFLNQYNESLKYFNHWPGDSLIIFLKAYSFMKMNRTKEAEICFNNSIHYYDSLLIARPELKTPDHTFAITDRYWKYPYFQLTAIWAAKGNKDKAMYYLMLLRKNWLANDLQVVTFLKYFPMLENIRNEPEFQEYLHEVEIHYLAEHKKVEKLLQGKGILQ